MPNGITRRQALEGAVAAGLALCAAGTGAGATPDGGAASGGGSGPRAGGPGALITRPIPATGERLPVIGIGTNNYNVDAADALAARRAVLDRLPQLGGAVVDTAPLYGRAEAVIGDLVATLGNRERLFLATKVMVRDAAGARASMEQSLAKLRTPRVDLMQVHNLIGVEATIPVLQEWKQAGRIRYYGITTSNPADHPQLIACLQRYPLDFIQVDYSLGDRGAATDVLPAAQQHGVAVIANTPFGGRRAAAGVFARVAGRALPPWAAEIGVTSWSQFFLKYVISHPVVTCTVPGTTEVAHLEDNLQAARGTLADPATRQRMEQFWDGLPG